MFGYMGKLLRVSLNDKTFQDEVLNEGLAQLYLGGRGVAGRMLYDELPASVDPLGSKNKLFFMTGVLNGIGLRSARKVAVVTKSPLTGIFLKSMFSGVFPDKLKSIGYDGIVIEGAAEKPTYLLVRAGKVEFHDASFMWGMTTLDAQHALKRIYHSEPAIAVIGPGGENLVSFASIHVDHRVAGRGGAGAVMGSKKLKAIVVEGGNREVQLAHPDRLKETNKYITDTIRRHANFGGTMPKYGTAWGVMFSQEVGILPTRNYSAGVFESASEISGETMKEEYIYRTYPCPGCPMACRMLTKVTEGEYAGTTAEGPEYETIALLGSNCCVGKLNAIIAASKLCDLYGVDTISTGNVIAFAMECFEKGLLSSKVSDVELRFGNDKALVSMIKKIAYREGIGDLLAQGVRRAAGAIGRGSEKFAMHVKGMEMPGYEPRGMIVMALQFALSQRGACHLLETEWDTRKTLDNFSPEGVAEALARGQDWRNVLDSIGLCRGPLLLRDIPPLIETVLGTNLSDDDLVNVGERIAATERLFNIREGISREDDTLPARILTEKAPTGPANGRNIAREDLDLMLDQFYACKGWDKEGIPTAESLRDLGMVADRP